ncbi:MAG: hypothetical protein WD397_17735 [Wenzhouxiangellaceae bacterium]
MLRILPALRGLLFALVTMSLVASTGCGLKGDLVLPEQSEQSRQTDAPSPPEDPEEDPEVESTDRHVPSQS